MVFAAKSPAATRESVSPGVIHPKKTEELMMDDPCYPSVEASARLAPIGIPLSSSSSNFSEI
jgi:hypothetical protein